MERLARDLKTAFSDFKGSSARNPRYMQDLAIAWPELKILQQAAAKLPLFHISTLLNKVKSGEERRFYASKAIENEWGRNALFRQIESNLCHRKGTALTNFDTTLPKKQSDLAKESLKNPYLFDFVGIGEEMKEVELEKALIQHIKKFMLELFKRLVYVGNQVL